MRTREQDGNAGRTPIAPELLAAKLAAIRNYEYPEALKQIQKRPRLVEILWFLQWKSFQPGGLFKLVEEMIEAMPSRFQTDEMRSCRKGTCTLESFASIYAGIPEKHRPAIPHGDETCEHTVTDETLLLISEGRDRVTEEELAAAARATRGWSMQTFQEACFGAARQVLPSYLEALCIQKGKGFSASQEYDAHSWHKVDVYLETWFIDDELAALEQLMSLQAKREESGIAMTEVATLVFDRLDYALAEKVMVRIEGGSRFGKTEAISTWAAMRPGLARLVRVPSDNSMGSFFRRIGEALGIDTSYGSNLSRLKDRVEFVIRNSGLFLVLDEAHFLVPMNFTATTAPHRLNWVRTEITDRGLPVALSVTPQAFRGGISRFVKKTGYDMTQFFGRDFLPCTLPDALSEADLIAVARVHFPTISENALGYIASEARLSPNYLQAVEAIARRSRYLAERRGSQIKVRDIEAAAREVLQRGSPPGAQENIHPGVEPSLNPSLRAVKPAQEERSDSSRFSSRASNVSLVRPPSELAPVGA